MNVVQQLDNEFTNESFGMAKAMGLPELHAKLVGILYISLEPIALEDLAIKSGYSLSTVSTAMKFLINIPGVKKTRKPGDKKIYFQVEHDTALFMKEMLKSLRERKFKQAKEFMPKLIKKYEPYAKDNKILKAKLQIIKKSYEQTVKVDQIFKKTIEELNKI